MPGILRATCGSSVPTARHGKVRSRYRAWSQFSYWAVLPDAIGDSLWGNQLTVVPEVMGDLTTLTALSLSDKHWWWYPRRSVTPPGRVPETGSSLMAAFYPQATATMRRARRKRGGTDPPIRAQRQIPDAAHGWVRLDAGHVCGEEVNPVAVEVSACSVAVLGGAWVGMTGEELRATSRQPRRLEVTAMLCRGDMTGTRHG
jgi:hypothetical protein